MHFGSLRMNRFQLCVVLLKTSDKIPQFLSFSTIAKLTYSLSITENKKPCQTKPVLFTGHKLEN